MLKNVGGQNVGVQIITTAGAAFTATATCYVIGDGSRATGTNAASHLGGGYYNYSPATGETNFNHIAFQFIAAGCVTQVVQLYTDATYDRVGAAGAGLTGVGGFSATARSQIETEVRDVVGTAGNALTDLGGFSTTAKGQIEQEVTDVVGAAGANLTNVGGFSTTARGQIQTEVEDVVGVAGASLTGVGGFSTTARGQITTATLATQMTESYRANGAAPTLAQFACEMLAHHGEAAIAGTAKSLMGFDHTTTAMTFGLNSSTVPTAVTRST